MPIQSIQLKRKRDEEALDIVYLEQPRQTKRLIEVFRRIHEQSGIYRVEEQQNHVITIPTIQTTEPGAEKKDPYALRQNGAVSVENPTEDKRPTKNAFSGPRIFQFTRPNLKRKSTEDTDIPTFVEKKAKYEGTGEEHVIVGAAKPGTENTLGSAETTELAQTPVRKRPSRGARIRQPTKTSDNRKDDSMDPELMVQMQAFALEVAEKERKETPQPVASPQGGDDGMDVDDANTVYDVYVRTMVPVDAIDFNDPSLGVLRIAEEDEEYWDQFANDDETGSQVADDEEDENAEDWYGADYPEDELSSEDERDETGATYRRYRRHGSDDEEFGLGEWDEEGQKYWDGSGTREGNNEYEVMGEYGASDGDSDEDAKRSSKNRMPWKGW